MVTHKLSVSRHRVVAWTMIALTALLLSGLAKPGSASAAAPISHDQFSFEFAFVDDQFCGDLNMRVEGDVRGTATVKVKDGQLIYFMENTHLRHSYTNLDTGKTATDVSNRLSKDQRVTDNGDGTLTIHADYIGHESLVGPDGGRPTTLAGRTSFVFVVDYAGTLLDPSDDVLISEDIVGSTGTGMDGDFCEIVREATAN